MPAEPITPPPSAHATHKDPQPYANGPLTDTDRGTVSLPGGSTALPEMPAVPNYSSSGGKTSVDTSAIAQFAINLESLASYLQGPMQDVQDLKDLAAGSFKEAEDLKMAVTGSKGGSPPPPDDSSGSGSGSDSSSGSGSGSGSSSSGSGSSGGSGSTTDGSPGLRGNLAQAIHDLRTTLLDTSENLLALVKKYDSIAEINEKAGSDLQTLLSTAESDLGTLQQDQL